MGMTVNTTKVAVKLGRKLENSDKTIQHVIAEKSVEAIDFEFSVTLYKFNGDTLYRIRGYSQETGNLINEKTYVNHAVAWKKWCSYFK